MKRSSNNGRPSELPFVMSAPRMESQTNGELVLLLTRDLQLIIALEIIAILIAIIDFGLLQLPNNCKNLQVFQLSPIQWKPLIWDASGQGIFIYYIRCLLYQWYH